MPHRTIVTAVLGAVLVVALSGTFIVMSQCSPTTSDSGARDWWSAGWLRESRRHHHGHSGTVGSATEGAASTQVEEQEQQQEDDQTAQDSITTVDAGSRIHPHTGWTYREIEEMRNSPDAQFDIVYMWVNGSEPVYAANRAKYRGPRTVGGRDRDSGELRMSLRSLDMYMPWWNGTLYFVHQNLPHWFNFSHPRLKLVHHRDIFLWQSETLPTFNSDAIEGFLYRIPGIRRLFALFNDDFLLAKRLRPSYFVQDGKPVLWFEKSPVNGNQAKYEADLMTGVDLFAIKLLHSKLMIEAVYPHTTIPFRFLKHAPWVMDRDRLAKLWEVWPEELGKAVRYRFRRGQGVEISWLHHHYCLVATPDECVNVPVTISDRENKFYAVGRLSAREIADFGLALTRHTFSVVCLNDETDQPGLQDRENAMVQGHFVFQSLLPPLYQFPSSWEVHV